MRGCVTKMASIDEKGVDAGEDEEEDTQQRCIENIHENLKELQNCAFAFVESIRRLQKSSEALVTFIPEDVTEDLKVGFKDAGYRNHKHGSQSFKQASQKMLTFADSIENFAKQSTRAALNKLDGYVVTRGVSVDPVGKTAVTVQLSADEIINGISEVTDISTKGELEEMMCRNVLQAHYELKTARRFHKELMELRIPSKTSSPLIRQMEDRINRTLRILSMSIREIVKVNKVYEDFFYNYLAVMNSDDTAENADGSERGHYNNDADSIGSEGAGEGDRRNNKEKAHRCLAVIESLTNSFMHAISFDNHNL